MKLHNSAILLIANTLVRTAFAAPIVTITHTAQAVTQTITYTHMNTRTIINTQSGAPPETDMVSSTSVPTTTAAEAETSTSSKETTSTTPEVTPTTSSVQTSTSVSTTSASSSLTSNVSPSETTTTSSTATSSTSEASSTTLTSFEQDILDAHNNKRDLHGVQHLTWNSDLAQYAADYAAKSFSCDNVQLIHSGGPYGENLAAGYSGGYSPVEAWYDEIKDYDYSNPGFSESTGHFTQVVWKSTSELGCARVVCDNEWSQYTICEYTKTRGNIVGTDSSTGKSYFEENVLEPISS